MCMKALSSNDPIHWCSLPQHWSNLSSPPLPKPLFLLIWRVALQFSLCVSNSIALSPLPPSASTHTCTWKKRGELTGWQAVGSAVQMLFDEMLSSSLRPLFYWVHRALDRTVRWFGAVEKARRVSSLRAFSFEKSVYRQDGKHNQWNLIESAHHTYEQWDRHKVAEFHWEVQAASDDTRYSCDGIEKKKRSIAGTVPAARAATGSRVLMR